MATALPKLTTPNTTETVKGQQKMHNLEITLQANLAHMRGAHAVVSALIVQQKPSILTLFLMFPSTFSEQSIDQDSHYTQQTLNRET